MNTTIENIIRSFEPISLAQMESVKLMNRIDTKFAVPMAVLPLILEAAQADYFAQEIDGKRIATYDTMYYDTETLDMYVRHHDRQLVRQKIRVRQYVDSHLTFLEVKRKNNKGRTQKKRIVVPGFDITADTPSVLKHKKREDEAVTVAGFIDSKSRYEWSQISPHLWTKFHRITLVNKAKTERLTIDMDLKFHNLKTDNRADLTGLVIIELKRDGLQPSPILGMLRELRIKPCGFSKYCIGSALTNPSLKRNNFKERLRLVDRLLSTVQQHSAN